MPIETPQLSHTRIPISVLIAGVFILLTVGIVGYLLPDNDPPPPARHEFALNDQPIPDRASSMTVNQSYSMLDLPGRPPFFEEKNVVQSLRLHPSPQAGSSTAPNIQDRSQKGLKEAIAGSDPSAPLEQVSVAPVSSDRAFLSFRVFRQNATAIRDAYSQYFSNSGWTNLTKDKNSLLFSKTPEVPFISVVILEVAATQDVAEHIVVAISHL